MEVKLKAKHIMMFSKIVSKMKVRPDSKGKDQEQFGMDLMFSILESIYLAEAEFWEMVSSLSGLSIDVIPDMEIDELKEVLMIVIEKVMSYFKKPATD